MRHRGGAPKVNRSGLTEVDGDGMRADRGLRSVEMLPAVETDDQEKAVDGLEKLPSFEARDQRSHLDREPLGGGEEIGWSQPLSKLKTGGSTMAFMRDL